MRRNVITTLLIGTWLSVVGQAVAFQSDYLSVKVEGNGPDLLLIHGFASSPQVWSGLAKEIGPGFRLHCVTVAGSAGSAAPKVAPESYLQTLCDEIARYINEEKLKK